MSGNSLDQVDSRQHSQDGKGSDRAVVTVIGLDKIGIVAGVANLLAESKVNILDISQTIFGELFSMSMLVDLSSSDMGFGEIKQSLNQLGSGMQLEITIQREEVFHFMHRV